MCEVWCWGSDQVGSRAEAEEKEVRAGRNSSSYFKAMPLGKVVESEGI